MIMLRFVWLIFKMCLVFFVLNVFFLFFVVLLIWVIFLLVDCLFCFFFELFLKLFVFLEELKFLFCFILKVFIWNLCLVSWFWRVGRFLISVICVDFVFVVILVVKVWFLIWSCSFIELSLGGLRWRCILLLCVWVIWKVWVICCMSCCCWIWFSVILVDEFGLFNVVVCVFELVLLMIWMLFWIGVLEVSCSLLDVEGVGFCVVKFECLLLSVFFGVMLLSRFELDGVEMVEFVCKRVFWVVFLCGLVVVVLDLKDVFWCLFSWFDEFVLCCCVWMCLCELFCFFNLLFDMVDVWGWLNLSFFFGIWCFDLRLGVIFLVVFFDCFFFGGWLLGVFVCLLRFFKFFGGEERILLFDFLLFCLVVVEVCGVVNCVFVFVDLLFLEMLERVVLVELELFCFGFIESFLVVLCCWFFWIFLLEILFFLFNCVLLVVGDLLDIVWWCWVELYWFRCSWLFLLLFFFGVCLDLFWGVLL